MPEQVGDAALLFDPRSSSDIARILLKLWNDDQLCEELSKRGKARADLFKSKVFNKNLLNIIKEMI
jgi:glycosyltransferase involved in cell wall biosynthesis